MGWADNCYGRAHSGKVLVVEVNPVITRVVAELGQHWELVAETTFKGLTPLCHLNC